MPTKPKAAKRSGGKKARKAAKRSSKKAARAKTRAPKAGAAKRKKAARAKTRAPKAGAAKRKKASGNKTKARRGTKAKPATKKRRPAPSPKRGAKAPRRGKKAPKRTTSPRKKAKPATLAAFSKQILEEEEEPVAVRSWTEAKQGLPGGKEYVHKTGEVRPTASSRAKPDKALKKPLPGKGVEWEEFEEDWDDDEPVEEGAPVRVDPLAGPAAVPKARVEEFEFRKRARRKKGAGAPEEFGQVELRQATASGGRRVAKAKAENLGSGSARIKPLASDEAAESGQQAGADDGEVTIQSDKRSATSRLESLADFGDVEIGQQTLSGSRKVGKLKRKSKS